MARGKSSRQAPTVVSGNWSKFKASRKRPRPAASASSTSQPPRRGHHRSKHHNNSKHKSSSRSVTAASRKAKGTAAKASETLRAAPSRYLALDCEMVVIVNEAEEVVYAQYVAQKEKVTDYRTHVSGIQPHHLRGAPSFAKVQKDVAELLRGRILVGHAVFNDLKALMLDHPRTMTRDSAFFPPYCKPPRRPGGRYRARKLKDLAKDWLGIQIQTGEHSPAEDARVSLRLFKLHKQPWEAYLKNPKKRKPLVLQLKPRFATPKTVVAASTAASQTLTVAAASLSARVRAREGGAPRDQPTTGTGAGAGTGASASEMMMQEPLRGPPPPAMPHVLSVLRRLDAEAAASSTAAAPCTVAHNKQAPARPTPTHGVRPANAGFVLNLRVPAGGARGVGASRDSDTAARGAVAAGAGLGGVGSQWRRLAEAETMAEFGY